MLDNLGQSLSLLLHKGRLDILLFVNVRYVVHTYGRTEIK